jgi:hypothetical protein
MPLAMLNQPINDILKQIISAAFTIITGTDILTKKKLSLKMDG